MTLVTVRIIDGPERGKTFHQIATPVSVGREEGNVIQLNDERVSRYHLKIHDNEGVVLLTDLQSTNGTRVNGEVVNVWRLRPGDLVSAGRSTFIFGSSEEIAQRLTTISSSNVTNAVPMGAEESEFESFRRSATKGEFGSKLELEVFRGMSPEELAPLHLLTPPSLPTGLKPKQKAEIAEFLQYLQLRLRYLTSSVRVIPGSKGKDSSNNERVTLSALEWQNLLDLYEKIALYQHAISEPK